MLGLFHWILGETPATPGGRLTLHVSVYEVPTSPDTTTTGASTTDNTESCETHIAGFVLTGPTTGLGRSIRATREIPWIPPTGRPVSSCVWSSSVETCRFLRDCILRKIIHKINIITYHIVL